MRSGASEVPPVACQLLEGCGLDRENLWRTQLFLRSDELTMPTPPLTPDPRLFLSTYLSTVQIPYRIAYIRRLFTS